MSEENVEVVRRLQEIFEAGLAQGDLAAARGSGLIADDFEFQPAPEMPAEARTYRGYAGFAEFMRSWTGEFERWTTQVERLIDAPDDRVVAFMHQSGIGKVSGATVDLQYGAIFELGQGRVLRISLFLTPTRALEAAGLSE